MAPPAPRRFFFTSSLAGRSRSTAPSRSTRSTGRCEPGGLFRPALLGGIPVSGLRAALAPRLGGSVSGADRSAEIARVNSLAHPRARARTEREGVRWPHRRRADSFSPLRWRGGADRPHHRGRPGRPAAASQGVCFDQPYSAVFRCLGCELRSRPVWAAASPALIVQQKLPALTHLLTLARGRGRSERVCDGPTGAAPILFHLFAGGAEPIDRTIEVDQVDRPLRARGSVSTSPTRRYSGVWVASCARAPFGRQRLRR